MKMSKEAEATQENDAQATEGQETSAAEDAPNLAGSGTDGESGAAAQTADDNQDAGQSKGIFAGMTEDEINKFVDGKINKRFAREKAKHEAEIAALKTEVDNERSRADELEKKLAAKDAAEALDAKRREIAKEYGIDPYLLRHTPGEHLEEAAAQIKELIESKTPYVPRGPGHQPATAPSNTAALEAEVRMAAKLKPKE